MNFPAQALYYYKNKNFYGQVKLTVKDLLEKRPDTDSEWRRGSSGSLSRMYIPFYQQRERYRLSGSRAVTVERSPLSSRWETVPVQPLAYKKEWYAALLSKVEGSLEELVGNCISFRNVKETRLRRFLGEFPELLRPDISSTNLYGTLGISLELSVLERDLSSYDNSHAVPKTNRLRRVIPPGILET